MRIALIVLMLAACAKDDSLQPPTGEIVHYKVDEQRFPATNTQARELGLDINGDGTIDNQLGMVISTLIYQDANPTTNVTTKLMTGEVTQLVDVQYASDTDSDDSIAFTLTDGSGSMSGDTLLGERTAKATMLGPGSLTLTFGFYDEVVQLELLRARASLDVLDPTQLQARLGGAARRETVIETLLPGFVRFVEARVARDCTNRSDPNSGCGCVPEVSGTAGKTWLGLFDVAPKDCVVSADEVLESSFVISLLAPDLTIDGESMLSFCIGIHASVL